MEAGTSLLLMDEDTSATNFMIRDELMQRVIHRDMEPITPFIDRIRELYEHHGISTVIVAGSSGAYFHVADRIIQMDRYVPRDITASGQARRPQAFPAGSAALEPAPAAQLSAAVPDPPRSSERRPDQAQSPGPGRRVHQPGDHRPAVCGAAG